MPARFFALILRLAQSAELEDKLGGRRINWPRGKRVGSCYFMADMLCVRGHASKHVAKARRTLMMQIMPRLPVGIDTICARDSRTSS